MNHTVQPGMEAGKPQKKGNVMLDCSVLQRSCRRRARRNTSSPPFLRTNLSPEGLSNKHKRAMSLYRSMEAVSLAFERRLLPSESAGAKRSGLQSYADFPNATADKEELNAFLDSPL